MSGFNIGDRVKCTKHDSALYGLEGTIVKKPDPFEEDLEVIGVRFDGYDYLFEDDFHLDPDYFELVKIDEHKMPSYTFDWSGSYTKASERQIGGDHYKTLAIQPGDYIRENGIGWYEGNAIKYITRHKQKGEKQDIEKAIHYLELILEEYDNA